MTSTTNDGQDLQFERAEYMAADPAAEGLQCAFCQTPLRSAYFQVNEQTACEACRYQVEQALQVRPGAAGFFRASAAGFGAAVVGFLIYWGVAALTNMEFGLVAILIGYMVGRAVRWGSRGRGGWVYQTLAMFLTYMAITTSYLPLIFKEIGKQQPAPAAVAAQGAAVPAGSGPVTQPASVPPAQGPRRPAEVPAEAPLTSGQFVLGLLFLLGLAAAAPFLAGFENILGLVIIAIGLWEAWKLNQRTKLEISGPFAVGRAAPAALAPQG